MTQVVRLVVIVILLSRQYVRCPLLVSIILFVAVVFYSVC